jgi:hypothetical protein
MIMIVTAASAAKHHMGILWICLSSVLVIIRSSQDRWTFEIPYPVNGIAIVVHEVERRAKNRGHFLPLMSMRSKQIADAALPSFLSAARDGRFDVIEPWLSPPTRYTYGP